MSGDIFYLQTVDGRELFVPDDEVKFIVYGGFGAPPVTFKTRRGYGQHGETEVGYRLEPRTVSAELWHSPACSRQTYWDNRLALHEFLRHNRGGPIQFVLRQPGGALRALTVRANPGLQFPIPPADQNNWSIDEQVDFLAHDPIWFDPEAHVATTLSSTALHLVFPATFPIRFGSASLVSDVTITYIGTWRTYPTITIFGPYTAVEVVNDANGAGIYLSVPVAGGDRRVIDLTPGAQSIVDSLGSNHFGDLDILSNLIEFCILPVPEAAGGLQTIEATFVGGIAGVTGLQVSYHDRYFAL